MLSAQQKAQPKQSECCRLDSFVKLGDSCNSWSNQTYKTQWIGAQTKEPISEGSPSVPLGKEDFILITVEVEADQQATQDQEACPA